MTTNELESLCVRAASRAADARLAIKQRTGTQRTRLIEAMGDSIARRADAILKANARDMAAASELSHAMRDRLLLTPERVEAMASAVRDVAAQPDPVGRVVEGRVTASGMRLEKRRIPIGVVLVVYESRPNVTADAAALCVKSANAVILRGGSEARETNRAVADALRPPLTDAGLADAVQLIDTADRRAVELLVTMRGRIDLVIPRGGPGLIRAVTDAATVPVIKHDAGNCHVYIDSHLDGLEELAERVTLNSKVQRPGVCNAAETLLIHHDAAPRILERVGGALLRSGVELRCCPRSLPTLAALRTGTVRPATEQDWGEEYLSLIMAVRVVDSIEDACAHIRRYGSQHTEAIITSSLDAAERFTTLLDSAGIMVNCSTRFADGGEYGLGAEIGISTDKLHARGPMGAEDLTTFQWVLTGHGQVRS